MPPLPLPLGDQYVVGQRVEVRQLSPVLPPGTHHLEPPVLPSADEHLFED
jgi:hypothetical protein